MQKLSISEHYANDLAESQVCERDLVEPKNLFFFSLYVVHKEINVVFVCDIYYMTFLKLLLECCPGSFFTTEELISLY